MFESWVFAILFTSQVSFSLAQDDRKQYVVSMAVNVELRLSNVSRTLIILSKRADQMLDCGFAASTMRSTAKRLARLPSTIKELLARPTSQEVVTVNGWIRSLRAQKRVAFVQINDGSCFSSLQAVMSPEEASS